MSILNSLNKAALVVAANEAITLVCGRLGEEHAGKGGFFRLYHIPESFSGYVDLQPLIAEWVGGNANRDGKFSKYEIISCEKAIRLAGEYARDNSIKSSMASWCLERQQYGGAIILRAFQPGDDEMVTMLFSISGLPEMGDEAAMLATPQMAKWTVIVNDIRSILSNGGIRNELAWSLNDEFSKERMSS